MYDLCFNSKLFNDADHDDHNLEICMTTKKFEDICVGGKHADIWIHKCLEEEEQRKS